MSFVIRVAIIHQLRMFFKHKINWKCALSEVRLIFIGLGFAVLFNSCGQSVNPVILFDIGHHNYGVTKRIAIQSWLMEKDFIVREWDSVFDATSLEQIDIVIIRSALDDSNENEENWRLPTLSAFSADEIQVLHEWTKEGGALLLILEHMPMAGAGKELARRFDVEVSDGFVVDTSIMEGYREEDIGFAGWLEFTRQSGFLASHPITNGSNTSDAIDLLATDVGCAFFLPSGATSLLTLGSSVLSLLPEVAWEFDVAMPYKDVSGWSQAAVMCVEKGRLAILGDAMLFIAPEMSESDREIEVCEQHPQFALNLLSWLAGQAPCY